MKLCDYEVKVLRECAGEPQADVIAGGALWAALGVLRGAGLVQANPSERGGIRYKTTRAGDELLASLKVGR